MRALIIGKGAREHALCWHLAQSPQITEIWAIPGNPGCADNLKTQCLNIADTDIDAIHQFVVNKNIDICFINTEAALNAGLIDRLQNTSALCFGPDSHAAKLETSNAFVRSFQTQHQIPAPEYQTFHDQAAALAFLQTQTLPRIIKTDDPTCTPALYIVHDLQTAEKTLKKLFKDNPNRTLLVEEYIDNAAFCITALTDGKNVLPIASSHTYRHLSTDKHSPLTGGMGACSPAPQCTETHELQRLSNEFIKPIITALGAEGNPYFGFLSITLAYKSNRECVVLDINCRLSDPDTQVILPRLQIPLTELCLMAKHKQLPAERQVTANLSSVAIMAVSEGYPTQVTTSEKIQLKGTPPSNSQLLHAGTTRNDIDELLTGAGRVFCAVAWEIDMAKASQTAYDCLKTVRWKQMYYRQDIAPAVVTP